MVALPAFVPPLVRPRRARSQVGPGIVQHCDVLVDAHGSLRLSPLLVAMSRELAPDVRTRTYHHAGVDIVCVMTSGSLRHESELGVHVLGPEDIYVLSTGTGLESRWSTAGDEPACALIFWFLGAGDREPRSLLRSASRFTRVGRLATLATRSALGDQPALEIRSAVLPVGASVIAPSHATGSYLVSTLGAVEIDGVTACPGEGVVGRGARHLVARESTEVVLIDVG